MQATFLPSGYPHTVAPHYLRNTLWQAVHHTCGSVNGGAKLLLLLTWWRLASDRTAASAALF